MNRKQQQVIDYLLEENRVLKQQLDASGRKLTLNYIQRRSLAKKGKLLTIRKFERLGGLLTVIEIEPSQNSRIPLK